MEEAAGASSSTGVPVGSSSMSMEDSDGDETGALNEIASVPGGASSAALNEESATGARLSIVEILPEEIMVRIFGFLMEGDLCRSASACRTFNRIANDPSLW